MKKWHCSYGGCSQGKIHYPITPEIYDIDNCRNAHEQNGVKRMFECVCVFFLVLRFLISPFVYFPPLFSPFFSLYFQNLPSNRTPQYLEDS
jgi:hypothetical protein